MLYAILAMIVLIIDQAMKYWTNLNLAVLESKPLIPGLVEFNHIHNNGAAYGLFDEANARWVFVAMTVIFTIVVIVLISRNVLKSSGGNVLLTLVMAGGVGNGIDRLINGYVVDMFHFQFPIFGRDFPVFNVADIFITVGGIIFCLWLIFHKSPEPKTSAPTKTRPMPRATERPKKGPDFLEQLAKPVVEAKAALESAEAEQTPEPSADVELTPPSDDGFDLTDSNLPVQESSADPFKSSENPFGTPADPFKTSANPFEAPADPFKAAANPFETSPAPEPVEVVKESIETEAAPVEAEPEPRSEFKEAPQIDPNDPFAEFLSKPPIHKETPVKDNTKKPSESASSKATPVKDDFSLESILAEFKE